jgi:hypothetical protein
MCRERDADPRMLGTEYNPRRTDFDRGGQLLNNREFRRPTFSQDH